MNNTICIDEGNKISLVITILFFVMINAIYDFLVLKRGLSFDEHANYCTMKYMQMLSFGVLFVIVSALGNNDIDFSMIVCFITGFIYSVNTIINYLLQIIFKSHYIDTESDNDYEGV